MTRFLFALLLVAASGAAQSSAPDIDASLSFENASNPQISPDGAAVVFQKIRTDWKSNRFVSEIWTVGANGSHVSQLLVDGKSYHCDPQWSPDGSRIAFISDRKNGRQIWIVPSAGGQARRMTDTERGVNLFHWAPDSKTVAFTTDSNEQAEGARAEKYGVFEIVKAESVSSGLRRFTVPGPDTSTVPLDEVLMTDQDLSVNGFAFSPDGAKIAFHAEREGGRRSGGIYSLDLNTRRSKRITQADGIYRNPVWSPDGRWIAFEQAASAEFLYSNWLLGRVRAEGGIPEVLTAKFDENADLVSWTDRGIWFGALQRTASHLFLLDPERRSISRITGPEAGNFSQFSITARTAGAEHWAGMQGSLGSLPEVMVDGKSITEFGLQLNSYQVADREVVRWKNANGTELEGILMKPANFDPTRKYPLLVALHGGPVAVEQPMVRADRTYPLELFVERGALVFRPNYRGSAGYGAKLRSMNVRELGSGDTADVLAGIDALAAKGFVDTNRVGAMGWSQGGFIAAFLGMATDRFRAVSVGAGISDWMTYYVNTDITTFTRQYMLATPWEDPEVYRRASPITYLNNAKTPTLIQHGDQDRRVPIPNAYELRQALEDRGIPVKMYVYRGFGHSIDRPKQQRAVMEHNLEWFTEWVLAPPSRKSSETVTVMSAGTAGDRTEPASLNTAKK